MSVDLGLKKIASPELEKKILLVKLFDVNELLNDVKTENMLLLDKIKNLELELSVAREQTDRSASSKLDHILSVQKSLSDKTGLGFVESISVPAPLSTNFVPSSSSEPHVSEVVKLSVSEVKSVEVTPPRKIGLIFISLNLRLLTLLRAKHTISLHEFVIFVESLGTFIQTVTSCKLLSEQTNQKYLCLMHKIL